MKRLLLVAAAALGLAACQESRPGPYGGGYGSFHYDQRPEERARAGTEWQRRDARERGRGWRASDPSSPYVQHRLRQGDTLWQLGFGEP
jgi:hypothetical protein